MATATLHFDRDHGFELDLAADESSISLRCDRLPVRVDGTIALSAGPVALDRLDVLFKASATMDGEPAQLHGATLQLVDGVLVLHTEVEDVETGDVVDFDLRIPVSVPADAPASGGPLAPALDEDELDWADETTMERVLGSDSEAAPARGRAGGLASLLQAIRTAGEGEDEEADGGELDGDEEGEDGDEFDTDDGPFDPAPAPNPIRDESRSLVDIMLKQEWLAIAEDADVDALADAIAPVLGGRGSAETKAARIGDVLLSHPAVDEVFVDDDALAEFLERW